MLQLYLTLGHQFCICETFEGQRALCLVIVTAFGSLDRD